MSAGPHTLGPTPPRLHHATTVALGTVGALLRGRSGAGKSDLALRFLADQGRWPEVALPRTLIADDQTLLTATNGRLVATAPAAIAGLIEVRGVGIVGVPSADAAEVRLVVDLIVWADVERWPSPDRTLDLDGVHVLWRTLDPFEPAAALKLALLLGQVSR